MLGPGMASHQQHEKGGHMLCTFAPRRCFLQLGLYSSAKLLDLKIDIPSLPRAIVPLEGQPDVKLPARQRSQHTCFISAFFAVSAPLVFLFTL